MFHYIINANQARFEANPSRRCVAQGRRNARRLTLDLPLSVSNHGLTVSRVGDRWGRVWEAEGSFAARARPSLK